MTIPTTELTTSLTPGTNAEAVVDLGAVAHNVRILRRARELAQDADVVRDRAQVHHRLGVCAGRQ